MAHVGRAHGLGREGRWWIQTCWSSSCKQLQEHEWHQCVHTAPRATHSSLLELLDSFCTIIRTTGSRHICTEEKIKRRSAYTMACRTSTGILPVLLAVSTIRSRGQLGIAAASPFILSSTRVLLDAVSPGRSSQTISLDFHNYVPIRKTQVQESNQSWSFKMHNSE